MINVIDNLKIFDRWVLEITKIKENTKFSPNGTDYILLQNGNFFQKNISLSTVNAAITATAPYEVSGNGVVISYPGLRLLENRIFIQDELDFGNLSYIDGGSNTTAINPGRLGDPVVNYVYFPPKMHQTLHTHPSHRIGLILKGSGRVELDNGFYDVTEGEVFFMRRNELHNFLTDDQEVVLFVFAPDSGTGPTDEINPLKIRTYIGQQRSVQ